MAVGFKNGTDGSIQVAVDGIQTARHPHHFLGINAHGRAAVLTSTGHPDGHLILRGGKQPNYAADSVRTAFQALHAAALPARVMIDASHANSGKDYRRQPWVVRDIAHQIGTGEYGIKGVMLESFLVEGRQDLGSAETLTFGQSVTDACVGWEMTARLLEELATAVRARRAVSATPMARAR
jgi:3-deoxy-7-phosphoheptulonate synthase